MGLNTLAQVRKYSIPWAAGDGGFPLPEVKEADTVKEVGTTRKLLRDYAEAIEKTLFLLPIPLITR